MGAFLFFLTSSQYLNGQITGPTDICFGERTPSEEYKYDLDWGLYGINLNQLRYFGDNLPTGYADQQWYSSFFDNIAGVHFNRPGTYDVNATYYSWFQKDQWRSLQVRVALANDYPNGDAVFDVNQDNMVECAAPYAYFELDRTCWYGRDAQGMLDNWGMTDFRNPTSSSEIIITNSNGQTWSSGVMNGDWNHYVIGGNRPDLAYGGINIANDFLTSPGSYTVTVRVTSPCGGEPQEFTRDIFIQDCRPRISAKVEEQSGSVRTKPAQLWSCSNNPSNTSMMLDPGLSFNPALGSLSGLNATIQKTDASWFPLIPGSGSCTAPVTRIYTPQPIDLRNLFPTYASCLAPNTRHILTLSATNGVGTTTKTLYLKIDGQGAYNVAFDAVTCQGMFDPFPSNNSLSNPWLQKTSNPLVITGLANTGTLDRYWISIDEVNASTGAVIRNVIDGVNAKTDVTATPGIAAIIGKSMNSYIFDITQIYTGTGVSDYFVTPSTQNKVYKMTLFGENSCSGSTPYSKSVFFTNVIVCRPSSTKTGGGTDKPNTNEIANTEEISQTEVLVFPNPFKDNVVFRATTESEGNQLLIVSDINGKIVYSSDLFLSAGENQFEVPTSDWAAGLYIYRLGQQTSGKIIKE